MEILFESFPRLRMNALMRDIWILLVTRALVILATVRFPIAKAHPAKIVFTVITLHMVTTAIFFYADVTFWTLQN